MTESDRAVGYVQTHCRYIGAYCGDSAPSEFLAQVADDMAAAKPTELFPERYREHVAYAIRMVAQHFFLEPPAAIAAVYLATRFEFYFRVLSGVLKADGTWLNRKQDQPAAMAALGGRRLAGSRVSDVALAYKLMKLNRSRLTAQVFDAMDRALFSVPTSMVGGHAIEDIGDRIAFGRHSASHGYRGDISSEAVFYGLLTAIVFYTE